MASQYIIWTCSCSQNSKATHYVLEQSLWL